MTHDELLAKYPRPAGLIDDKVRTVILDDFMYRLALGHADEAAIGAYAVLDELNEIAEAYGKVERNKNV